MLPAKIFSSFLRQTPGTKKIVKRQFVHKCSKSVIFNRVRDAMQEKYNDIYSQPCNIKKEQWEEIRKFVTESESKIVSVDAAIFEAFRQQNRPDLGVSYFNFLENNKYDISMFALYKYLEMYIQKEDHITEAEKDTILRLYRNRMGNVECLNVETGNVLVSSLCKIGELQKAIKVIEKFERSDCQYLKLGYSDLISYCFLNNKVELGYKYLEITFKRGAVPFNSTYINFFEYCNRNSDTFTQNIEKLFGMWNKYGIKPLYDVILKCMEVCNLHGWSALLTTTSGVRCYNCNQNLTDLTLTDEEYNELRSIIKDKLIFRKMYDVTVPLEMKRFMKFIGKNKPYDIILDGLNILYTSTHDYPMLRNYLTHCVKRKQSVLIIGRQHLKVPLRKWGCLQLADYFFVDDQSKDDLFLLYAAFSSRRDTKVISNDLMRNHNFMIHEPKLICLFKKWQLSQQYAISPQGIEVQKLTARTPIDGIVSKKNNCWHLPYHLNKLTSKARHVSKTDWACFKVPKS